MLAVSDILTSRSRTFASWRLLIVKGLSIELHTYVVTLVYYVLCNLFAVAIFVYTCSPVTVAIDSH